MELESSFEAELRDALLDSVEHELVGRQGNLVHEFVQEAHDRLREYGREFDMNVEPIIESLGQPEVDRGQGYLTVRIGWEHEAAGYFELGTPEHTIEGDPVLSFVWEPPVPQWVRHEFSREGDGFRVFLPEVDHPGMPESRFVRDTLHWLRRRVQR